MQRGSDSIVGKVPLSFDGTGFDERGGIAVYPDPAAAGLGDLKAALFSRGIRFGTTTYTGFWRDADYMRAMTETFGCINAETQGKMDWTQPTPEGWDFAPLDSIVDFAYGNGQEYQPHTLFWWMANPQWLIDAPASSLKREMLRRIVVMMERYSGHYVTYVLNEIYGKNGELVQSPWLRMGDDYPIRALEIANEMAPGRVGYNGTIAWCPGEKKRVLELARRGLIQYVGCQYHIPAMRQVGIDAFLRDECPFWAQLLRLGVNFEITEMDVRIKTPGSEDDRYWQAETWAQVVKAALGDSNFVGLHTWGVDDGHSWVPYWKPGWGEALLLDADYRPKAPYFRLLEVANGMTQITAAPVLSGAASHNHSEGSV